MLYDDDRLNKISRFTPPSFKTPVDYVYGYGGGQPIYFFRHKPLERVGWKHFSSKQAWSLGVTVSNYFDVLCSG